MTLSTRVAIQWPPKLQYEDTNTMVFTSPENHFVDIRIYKHKFPCKMTTNAEPFDKVFQWCLVGEEEPIANTSKILFRSVIDSQAISRSIKTNKSLKECEGDDDIGDFSLIEGTDDRKETGVMINPETGQKQDYIEIWRSLDPEKNTPKVEIKEAKIPKPYNKYVLSISRSDIEGRMIRLGNWIQGIVYDKLDKNMPIHVLRSFYNFESAQWEPQIEYGNISLFPIDFKGELGDNIHVDDKIIWKCIEV